MNTNTTYSAVAGVTAAFSAVSTNAVVGLPASTVAQLKPGTHRDGSADMIVADSGRIRSPRGIPL
jgi:hypothetical protein